MKFLYNIFIVCYPIIAKIIASNTTRAGLSEVLGSTGTQNIHGDVVQKLDEFAELTIYRLNDHTGRLAVMASEEEEEIIPIPERYPTGKYVLLYDPLDGSSNIDVNVSIGTIFSVLKRNNDDPEVIEQVCEEDFLQKGSQQVAAGYCVYGPQTTLVLTVGDGVAMFTLDREQGSFVLTQDDVQIPADTKEFAINMSNMRHWDTPIKRYVDECLAGVEGPRGPRPPRCDDAESR